MLTSSVTFKKSLLGIVTLVAVPVLVFVIEQKLSQTNKSTDRQPTQPTEPAVVAVQGQVMDFATKHVLEGVVVRVHVLSVDMEQTTDELGR